MLLINIDLMDRQSERYETPLEMRVKALRKQDVH